MRPWRSFRRLPPPPKGHRGGAGRRNLLGGRPTSRETTVASCETDWLLAFAANNKNNPASRQTIQLPRQPSRPSGLARPTHAQHPQPPTRLQLPPCPRPPPRPAGAACLPEVEPRAGARLTLRGGGGGGSRESDAVEQRRRWLRLEAATARALARGGTALTSGPSDRRERCTKRAARQGLAARRGLRVTLGAPGLRVRSVGPHSRGRPPLLAASRCPPPISRAWTGPGAEGLGPRRARRGAGLLTLGAPPQAPGWPGRSWPPSALPLLVHPSASRQAQPLTRRPLASMRPGGRLQAGLLFVCFPVHCMREDHGAAGTE